MPADKVSALSQPLLNIEHRSADIAVIGPLAVFNSKHDFGELDAHTDDSGKPHPEYRAGSSDHDCTGNACDIGCTYRASESGRKCLKRGKSMIAFLLYPTVLLSEVKTGSD